MKTIVQLITASCLLLSASARGNREDPWKSVGFQNFASALAASMEDYREWSENWLKSGREIDNKDHIINSMLEVQMVAASKCLRAYPIPGLLKQCLLFLGRNVPEEFEDNWAFVFLELPDVDGNVATEVNRMLKKEGFRTFEERLKAISIRNKNEKKKKQ